MHAHTFFSSFLVKFIHIIVVVSIALTSAFSAAPVKRVAAQSPVEESSGFSLRGLLSQVVPFYHRRQALLDKMDRLLGIDAGASSWQAAEPTPAGGADEKPTPTQANEPVPTLTAALTPSPDGRGVPTANLTPTGTLAPSVTPEPTLTELPCLGSACITPSLQTPLPTGESSTPTPPGDEEMATPVITDTTPISGEIDALLAITLTLAATPTLPAPGDIVTLTWELNRDRPPDGLELRLTLPEGIELWGVPEGAYDPATRQLIIPIATYAGSLSLEIPAEAEGPYAFNGELWKNGKLVKQHSLSLPRRGPFKLNVPGGHAWGFNRRVEVNFPEGALPEAAEVEVKPPAGDREPRSLGGRPFEIVAYSQANGEEITQFTRPITIEVSYDEAQYGNEESGLKLFYYDETSQAWYPLPTRVDTEHNTLTAWSEHLTLFDFQAQNWEAARLPNLEAFQVSSFTGSSAYSLQLQVPPGPGGLQPSVSLSYNSQTVDGASSRTQASWVGMGWNLSESYIQRNQNGTADFYGKEYNLMAVNDADFSVSDCHPGSSNNWCGSDGDDTFSLVVDGQSWTLIRVADNDGDQTTIEYRTTSESYWRIIRYHSHGNWGGYPADTSYWYVWDKTGTRFKFESTGVYPAYPTSDCSNIFIQTWQYSLTKTRSVFGPELSYAYYQELSDTPKYAQGCSGYASGTVLAVYPDYIVYPNNRYLVSFVRSGTLRTDWKTGWEAPASTVLYKRSLLERVDIWYNPSGSWSSGDEQLVRRYVLGYAAPENTIFPSVVWLQGGKTPTLISITEYGFGGASALPATTFTYGDDMHLTVGSNGYGGQVRFDYEDNPWYEVDGDGSECSAGGNVVGEIYMDTKSVCSVLGSDWNWFRPMAVYKVSVEVKKYNRASTAKLGMDDGVLTQYGSELTLSGSYQLLESYFTLSIDADKARSKLSCTGDGCYFKNYQVIEVTTRYRVNSRTALDARDEYGATIQKSYLYDEPATNDAAHSAFIVNVPENQRTSPAYGEYRGNGMVKEKDAGGKISTTFYYQDDNRNGSASVSLVGTENLTETFPVDTWSSYSSKWASVTPTPVFERVTGDMAAKVVDTSGTWNSSIYRTTYSVEDNEAVIVQFRVSTISQQTIIAVNSNSPDNRRWGVK